ncbi:acyl-CoA dehydrogenase family protein [Microbacterium sp. Sa4CUA7]|uniref:Acyl-[acyl-carrier-protein] dehydrogenase MbtN n=1 Tax=Microbacterium pullorum TaxID=2762236 RepID=A0ABR8S3P8_9MICO|nr:acyl-CoA dehydrogenase family protein [Microbacterium pullorum]MBD7958113.1 acyl-CoA dehydrogenase family protein [Microbacterium pullorum]
MKSTFYTEDHEAYRQSVREFLRREVEPHYAAWEDARIIDRAVWLSAGANGMLGLGVPEEFGGGGEPDYRYRFVFGEEIARAGVTSFGVGIGLQDDIVIPYLLDLATDEQKRRWLPGMADGSLIGAIAMTEPGTGSDLQGIRTTAVRDGDEWVLNGSKTFITSGIHADLVIVVAKTDPQAGSRGFSLFVVEAADAGFTRGRQLDKIGLSGQDTAELFFQDVRVGEDRLLGRVGGGMRYLMERLPRERLSIAAAAVAASEAAIGWTLDYVYDRTAFGQRIGDFQNTRFVLAELETETDITRAYVERAALALNDGELTAVEASKAKWWASELQVRVTTRCLQLFGGAGYMLEYPIARAYRDARIQTIYGGTTEIMKEIIGREQAARYTPQ